jgi:hypothetical protein
MNIDSIFIIKIYIELFVKMNETLMKFFLMSFLEKDGHIQKKKKTLYLKK